MSRSPVCKLEFDSPPRPERRYRLFEIDEAFIRKCVFWMIDDQGGGFWRGTDRREWTSTNEIAIVAEPYRAIVAQTFVGMMLFDDEGYKVTEMPLVATATLINGTTGTFSYRITRQEVGT